MKQKSGKGKDGASGKLKRKDYDKQLQRLLTGMDLKSYSGWFDYSRARDEMFAATDTGFAPWYVAGSDDKKRTRLNIISHLLGRIPYEDVPRAKVKLPKRQKAHGYREPEYPYKYVEERF